MKTRFFIFILNKLYEYKSSARNLSFIFANLLCLNINSTKEGIDKCTKELETTHVFETRTRLLLTRNLMAQAGEQALTSAQEETIFKIKPETNIFLDVLKKTLFELNFIDEEKYYEKASLDQKLLILCSHHSTILDDNNLKNNAFAKSNAELKKPIITYKKTTAYYAATKQYPKLIETLSKTIILQLGKLHENHSPKFTPEFNASYVIITQHINNIKAKLLQKRSITSGLNPFYKSNVDIYEFSDYLAEIGNRFDKMFEILFKEHAGIQANNHPFLSAYSAFLAFDQYCADHLESANPTITPCLFISSTVITAALSVSAWAIFNHFCSADTLYCFKYTHNSADTLNAVINCLLPQDTIQTGYISNFAQSAILCAAKAGYKEINITDNGILITSNILGGNISTFNSTLTNNQQTIQQLISTCPIPITSSLANLIASAQWDATNYTWVLDNFISSKCSFSSAVLNEFNQQNGKSILNTIISSATTTSKMSNTTINELTNCSLSLGNASNIFAEFSNIYIQLDVLLNFWNYTKNNLHQIKDANLNYYDLKNISNDQNTGFKITLLTNGSIVISNFTV